MTIRQTRPVVEAAVDTLDAALAAVRAGADRLELCARLDLDGLTPAPGLTREVLARVAVPVMVMIRPRGGDFVYGAAELGVMERDIHTALSAGAAGVVIGAITGGGAVDTAAVRRLLLATRGMPATFHRAFDRLRAPEVALGPLGELGVRRVLTSGGAETAWAGRDRIRRLVGRAPAGLDVLAGGGVRGDHVAELVRDTGAREVHLAASRMVAGLDGRAVSRPDPGRLRAVVAALAN